MKIYKISLSIIYILLLLGSCTDKKGEKKFVIAFSQCQEDVWRNTMSAEMQRELSFHNNIEFIYRDAAGSSKRQVQQIEELIKQKIDLLIVSPNEERPLTPIIEQVYDEGIPVVLVDRKINSQKYTAFIGASNFEVGQNAGRYAVSLLNGQGNLIEIMGLSDATPFIERHRGFVDIISQNKGINFIKTIEDHSIDYKKNLDSILQHNQNIDLIFSQNDFIASDVCKECKKLAIKRKIKIIGVDGLADDSLGMFMVANNLISATVLYPTGGKEAILTSLKILGKEPFLKDNLLATTIIDSSNVRIMKLQNDKVLAQQEDIDKRQKKIDQQIVIAKNQAIIIITISLLLTLAIILGGILFYYLNENRKINKKLEKQKEEISSQSKQLIELMDKAQEASNAKLNFFTNISHEFRTPLTLILAPLEDLLANTKIQSSTQQTLQLIQRNVIRLYRLINQLMDFRKIEFKKMKVKASENDLVAFIKEITDSYAVLARQKHIDLNFFTSERSLNAWFDPTMIDKVIFNLLSNAFKFTKENGFIHVSISKALNNAIVKVEDNGVGMTKDAIYHAFEPFFQGEYENYKGSGLGLALSKEFIEMHHGQINISSEKWKGTQFQITIPLGKEHLEKDEIITNIDNDFVLEDAKNYTLELLTNNVQINPDTFKSNYANRLNVLIIEDNDDLRGYLKSNLGNIYDILESENGLNGLRLAFDNIPDLIICDVVIPGKNGLEITKLLKNDVRTSHIPVILLTARSEEKQRIEGLETKADAYLTKPFNLQVLNQTINTLIANREKLKEHYSGEILIEEKSQVTKKMDRKFISEFAAIVENNIPNDNFGVDDICKEIGISRVQLYRKVKAILNCNVNEYIVNTRLQKAKFYLQHENYTMSEIAYKTGFSSAAYFATVFKSKFDCSPSEYKLNQPLKKNS